MDSSKLRTAEYRDELHDSLCNLSQSEVMASLEFDDCSEAYLHEVFFWYHDSDDDIRTSILNHCNCPDTPLLFALKYFPEWAEGSAALGLKKMAEIGGDVDPEWEKVQKNYNRKSFYYEKRAWMYQLMDKPSHRLSPPYGLSSWSSSFIEKLLARLDLDGVKSLADDATKKEIAQIFIEHKEYRVRRVAANKLSITYAAYLVNDASVAVRKTLAMRGGLPADVVDTLGNDKSDSVREALTANYKVAPANLESMKDGNDIEGIKSILLALRDRKFAEGKLLTLAEHPSGIVRYAAGLHKKAHKAVYEVLMKNPSDWSCAPVAGRSRNPEYLAQLVDSEHLDVIRHLAHNKKLDKASAIKLLEKYNDYEVRLGIANTFVEDSEIIEKIVANRKPNSLWELMLQEATNPGTSANKLREIYNESTILCIHKAIAQHPNCPKHQAGIFGCYMPAELKKNPKYALALVENKKLPYYGYSDWSHLNRMKEQTAPAFLSNAAAKRNSVEFSRGAANCPSVNAHFLDYAVLNGDQTTYKRLLSVNINKIGRFAQEIISLTTPANKKLLIKNLQLHAETIERLANDKDKSVQAALENSNQEFKATSNKDEKSSKSKNLGNKATRMELAEASSDNEVLLRLCQDKLPAVRAMVVGNASLSTDMLIPMLADSDSEVVKNALKAIANRTLDSSQQKAKQTTLVKSLETAVELEKETALQLIESIDDVSVIEQAYMMGKLSGLEAGVAGRVQSENVFSALLSQAKNLGSGNADWCAELAGFSGVDVFTFNEIVKISGSVVSSRIQLTKNMYRVNQTRPLLKVKSADVFIDIVKSKGWKSLKSAGCAYPADAEFTIEQMETLRSIAPGSLITLGSNCNKLSSSQLIETFELLDKKEKDAFVLHVVVTDFEFKEHIFNWCIKNDVGDEYQSSLSEYYEYQEPTEEQIAQGLKSKNEDIRCALARNRLVQGGVLEKLARDSVSRVRECLFYRGDADDVAEADEDVYDLGGQYIPDDIILILASDRDKYIKNRAKRILVKRGVDLIQVRSNVTSNITALLKKHDAPFGAAKANKKLLELGLLELGERESTSKPGVLREFKQLSDQGRKYGVNKFSQYGDATPEYFVDLFPELLKKIA